MIKDLPRQIICEHAYRGLSSLFSDAEGSIQMWVVLSHVDLVCIRIIKRGLLPRFLLTSLTMSELPHER